MKTIMIAALAASALLSGCATRAGGIAPVAVSSAEYANLSCAEAETALMERQARVRQLSAAQNRRALADTAGVALAFIPVGSLLTGSVAGDLAQAKGEAAAIERHMQMHCRA